MRKNFLLVFLLIISFFLLIPQATATEPKEEQECIDTGAICPLFGDPTDDGKSYDPDCDGAPSTANFLQEIFTFIRFLGPILAIVLSIIEFVKAAAAQDTDALMKAVKKTGWRIGLAIVLFFIPVIINAVFTIIGWYGTCGIN